MTQVWQGDNVVAVTKVQAGPCTVTQIKDLKKDGYSAIQFGYGLKKQKNIKKPQLGHLKDTGFFRFLKEFRLETSDLKKGDIIDSTSFEKGDKIQVSGVSKGKGFQGVVKRHGFSGQKATHGNKDQERMPGSAGATGPAHVFKGLRMGGRMGGDNVTTKNLEIIDVDSENNIVFIKGAVPGARNSLVFISGNGEFKIIGNVKTENKKIKKEEIKEDLVQEKEEIKKEELELENKEEIKIN